MENAPQNEPVESPSMTTYIIGAVLVVAVIAGAWYFRSRTPAPSTAGPTGAETLSVSPTPGPITELACDNPYFNPKIGFAQYYLSVEGGDVSTAKTVSCNFSASVQGEKVASATAESGLTPAPERNGATFRCTTDAVALTPGVPTVVDIALKDDTGATATCGATFTFPAP